MNIYSVIKDEYFSISNRFTVVASMNDVLLSYGVDRELLPLFFITASILFAVILRGLLGNEIPVLNDEL